MRIIPYKLRMNATLRSEEFRLCFDPLYGHLMPYEFRCDANGHVEFDALDYNMRLQYLYVRGLVGLDYHMPHIKARTTDVATKKSHPADCAMNSLWTTTVSV